MSVILVFVVGNAITSNHTSSAVWERCVVLITEPEPIQGSTWLRLSPPLWLQLEHVPRIRSKAVMECFRNRNWLCITSMQMNSVHNVHSVPSVVLAAHSHPGLHGVEERGGWAVKGTFCPAQGVHCL